MYLIHYTQKVYKNRYEFKVIKRKFKVQNICGHTGFAQMHRPSIVCMYLMY
jgi:hypothetical protein